MVTIRDRRRWMRLLGMAGCITMVAACQQPTESQPSTSGYETMKISRSNQTLNTAYSATIRGRQDIDIYPQVSGTIQQLWDQSENSVVNKNK